MTAKFFHYTLVTALVVIVACGNVTAPAVKDEASPCRFVEIVIKVGGISPQSPPVVGSLWPVSGRICRDSTDRSGLFPMSGIHP